VDLVEESPYRFRIERHGAMRVPGVVFASRALLPDAGGDRSLEQVANVATLPGIVTASFAMPDVHWGYGFPIGGVAATDVDAGGLVSPGGVGFDISCGVRLLAADLDRSELGPRLTALMDGLDRATPRGMATGAVWRLAGRRQLDNVPAGGSPGCRSAWSRADPPVGHTSSVTAHDQPGPSGPKRSPCSDTALGTAPTGRNRSTSAIRIRTPSPPSPAVTSISRGSRPAVSIR
jgi:hypothetical protein